MLATSNALHSQTIAAIGSPALYFKVGSSSFIMSTITPQLDTPQALFAHLIGTWTLVSYAAYSASTPGDESTAIYPYGPNATGFITYTREGHVSMHFSNPGQKNHQSGMPTDSSEAELAESARRYLAYAGSFYVVKNENRNMLVVHEPAISLYPNWVGTSQRRLCTLEEGGTMLVLRPEEAMDLNVSHG